MDVLSGLKSMPMNVGGRNASTSSASSSSSSNSGFESALRTSSSEGSRPTLGKKSPDKNISENNYSKDNSKEKSFRGSNPGANSSASREVAPPKDSQTLNKNVANEEIQKQNTDVPRSPLQQEEMVDSIPRRAALQTFIRKMKEEVGVGAEQIMAAISALSSQEMALPPAENLQAIISNLELNEEQKLVAENLFQDMLKQTASNSMAEHLKTSGRELSVEVMSQREARDKAMQDSLARMSENFFVDSKEQNPEKEKSALPAKAAGAGTAANSSFFSSSTASAPGAAAPTGFALPTGMQSVTPFDYPLDGMEPSSQNELAASIYSEGLGDVVEPQAPVPVENFKSLEEQLRGFKLEIPQAKSTASKQAQLAYEMSAPKTTSTLASGTSATAEAATGGLGALLASMGLAEGEAGQDEGDQGSQQQGFREAFGANVAVKAQDLNSAAMPKFEICTQPTAQQESANIRELINQAQFLSTKGGGEMKVALSPEGLGEIIMKVSVNSGQVNVEMTAENNEAKKLLERGMGELKATLASHKLNVENIKVDLQHSEISKQFDDQRGNAERQFAQDFLENFRQQNNGWRRSFVDIPGAEARGRASDKDSETETRIAAAQASSRRADKRLDLVA